MSRIYFCALVLITSSILSSACAGKDDAAPTEDKGFSSGAAAASLVESAGGEPAAITATLLAVDRGYSLRQLVEAALAGTFDSTTGSVTSGDGFAKPEQAAGDYFTDAPVLTSAGALAPAALTAESTVDETLSVVETFLSTPTEVLLVSLESEAASGDEEPNDPVLGQQAADLENFHTMLILALIDAGFSVEQVAEALVFGERFDCSSVNPVRCRLEETLPALPPINILDRRDAPQQAEGQGEAPAGGAWAGEVDYTDDTVGFELGASEVTIVRDDDEYSMTAELTYRTIAGTNCTFDWVKSFAGTGVADASGTQVTFEGTATTKNTSSCPDANLQDISSETTVVASLSGSTFSGVVFNSEFTAAGR